MRTYQRVNASNGFDAVGNMLIVGTAVIWVPIVAIWVGWMMLQQWLHIGEYSPKEVAKREALKFQQRLDAEKYLARVDRDDKGNITWTNPNATRQHISDALPITHPYAPKQGWLIERDGYIYELSDKKCVNSVGANYTWSDYQYTVHKRVTKGVTGVGRGCYSIRNGVVGLGLNERVVYFDAKDFMEGFILTATEAKAMGAKTAATSK